MFCGECGAKNKKTDAFCSECGASLVHEEEKQEVEQEVVSSKKDNKPKQPMTKKNKILICLIALVVIILGVGYKVGSSLNSPKKIAENYIKAYVSQDGGKLYKYLELSGDKTFVSKKIFVNLVKESSKDTKEIVNYKVTEVKYGDNKLTATVKFNYTVQGSSKEETSYVNLVKDKKKKFIFFDNWKITNMSESNMTKEDYKIKAPKGSKVVYAGVKLTDKYLDKNQSTSKEDVYVLPKVFTIAKASIKTTLPNGLELEEMVKPSSYSSIHTVDFDKNTMSATMQETLVSKAKEAMTTIYNNAIQNKAFDDIKSTFEHEGIDITSLQNSYDNLLSILKGLSSKLTSITFKDGSLYDVNLNEDGSIKVRAKLNYDYSIQYTDWNNETKKHDGSSYKTVTVVLNYSNKEYHLVSCTDFITYFSRY